MASSLEETGLARRASQISTKVASKAAAIRPMPSRALKYKSHKKKTASKVARSNNGISSRIRWVLIGMAAMMAVTPNTKPIFAIFEPIALPIAKLGTPFKAASAETNISGADVPKAMTVKPIKTGVIPKCLASEALPLTNILALQTSPVKPIMSVVIAIIERGINFVF